MKKYFKNIAILFIILIVNMFFINSAHSQCTNCGSNYPGGWHSTTSASWTNVSTIIWGSEWAYYTLNSSYMYQWSSSGNWDSQFTLYASGTCSGAYLDYNDDGGNSTGSWINYSPGTTSVRLLVSQFNCTSNTTGTTVAWRAIPKTPTISGGGVTICSGNSTTLTASNIGNNDQYVDVQWGTTSGGTQVSGDATSVLVSPTSNTVYYLRYRLKNYDGGDYMYSNVANTTVYVTQPPTASTSMTGTNVVCEGTGTSLTAVGGSNGDGATYQWYTSSCGGTYVYGSSTVYNVTPTATTTYYFRRRGQGACSSVYTGCVSRTVTVNTLSTVPSSIGTVIH